ncbi:MAG TPA: SDR family NAD(P)-dependent oxidoreductase [bacterium]|nr:SDR family NAD(P)-dependent oxidoreductase [bacterium]
MSEKKKVVIIGASQGIGAAVADEFSRRGCVVGITARNSSNLETVRSCMSGECHTRTFDASVPERAMAEFEALIAEMGGMDIAVINAGTGRPNRDLDWEPEKETIDINVTGFAAMCNVAYKHFLKQGYGKLAGVSSVIALRGEPGNPAYPATKAFASVYLESLRLNARKRKLPIFVTDIRPGFVDTPLTEGQKGMFWLCSSRIAATHIVDAVARGKSIAYIPPKWRAVGIALRHMPDFLYSKM